MLCKLVAFMLLRCKHNFISKLMSSKSLIESVKKRHCLWDNNDPHHNNRLIVENSWKEVEKETGINYTLAKSKWRGLRDYYRQQIRRNNEKSETQITPKWPHFELMSFVGNSSKAAFEAISVSQTNIKQEPETSEWLRMDTDYSEAFDIENDDLHFFKSIIPDLKNLTRKKKILLRLKIQQLIYNEIYSASET